MSTHRPSKGPVSKLARYRIRGPRFALDPTVVVAAYSVRGPAFRMPRRVRLSQVALLVVQHHDGRPVLKRYALSPTPMYDAVRVGPTSLEAVYDLGAPTGDPAALNPHRFRLEAKVVRRSRSLLESAAVTTGFAPVPEGGHVPRVAFAPGLPTPPVTYGFARPLPVIRSEALVQLARQRFGLGAAQPTHAQLAEAWDGVPERYVDSAGGQFLYPARFVAVAPWSVAAEGGGEIKVHPVSDDPMPEAAPSTPIARYRGWVFNAGEWRPAVPAAATIWFNGGRVSGRDYYNPAFKVLQDLNCVGESDTIETLVADEVEMARIRSLFMEMPPAARGEVNELMRRRAMPDVCFTDNDVFTALLNPGSPLRASEEPSLHLFRTSALRATPPGWELDLAALSARFTRPVGAADADVRLAVVGGTGAPDHAG